LREVNRVVAAEVAGAITIAEESTAFPGVTAAPWDGGLGFHYKWNLGWMHDTLAYFALDPVHRKFHHDCISFAMMYAYSEHFVLALSHDEVVHGKGSLYSKMWGDAWQKMANLRTLFALMFAHPGKKLLFMGSEFAQIREWNHDRALDWNVLDEPSHHGLQCLVRDLNHRYRDRAALHVLDDVPDGFRWINVHDRTQSVFSFIRHGHGSEQQILVVCNMTPVIRHGYRLGVPLGGLWREILNTDSTHYGGSGVGNCGSVQSQPMASHHQTHSLSLTLPPLAVLWLEPQVP
jgi:1,4-alpha-glucan branching enzyme